MEKGWLKSLKETFYKNRELQKKQGPSSEKGTIGDAFIEIDSDKLNRLECLLMSEVLPREPSMVAFLFAKPPRITRTPK